MATTPDPDFKALFEAAPGCYLVLTPALTIVGVSDAYVRATLTTREALLGRHLFDAFPDNPNDPTATGVSNIRASLERVLGERRLDKLPIQKYDIRRPVAEGGGFEERYWRPTNSPVFGPDGEITYIIHHVEDVTRMVLLERRRSEQDAALRELSLRGEERLRQVLDAAPDAMVVVDGDGRIRFANTQAETLFGYTRAELLGQAVDLLVPDRFRSVHARHVGRYVAAPTARAMGSALELFARRKDGSEVPIEVSLSPLTIDGELVVTAALRDISERKRLTHAATLSAARLASAVESIQDAFALFDVDGRLLLCNSVYRRLYAGIRAGALVGLHYEELLDAWLPELDFADAEARSRARAERLANYETLDADFNVCTRDGRSLRVMDRRTPEGGTVEIVWDLTDDARLADELREARRVAERANAAKSDFLSSMSHELRTPLNAILGFSQLLLRDKKQPLDDKQRGRVDQIVRGGEHLLRLIDEILDLSRIEAGGISISTEPVDALEVLEEVLTTLGPFAASAGIRLELTPVLGRLPTVAVDRTRYAQILMNFGSNAVKYNRLGGNVTFVATVPDPARVRVSVVDTGMGIPADKQGSIFQPFQRAGQEAGPIEGTGIGLAITKRLASLMGGSVGFESTHGKGSAFWVEVPIHTSDARAQAPAGRVELGTELTPNARILYVEDNPANVSFMPDLLGNFHELELVVARSAEEGIDIARSTLPTIIIMDINLPGMSGVDALRALRDWPETSKIPVIALTAAATRRDRERGEAAGFFRYLTKPVNVSELEAALRSLLDAAARP
jgi:PAS domain S-box-containing protein